MEICLFSALTLILLTLCVHSDRAPARVRSLHVNGALRPTWRIVAPRSFINLRVGLLNQSALAAHSGLLLRSRRVHMRGMLFSIDIIALDQRFMVLAIEKDAAPNAPVRTFPRATRYLLEIPAGQSDALNLAPGDHLHFGDARD